MDKDENRNRDMNQQNQQGTTARESKPRRMRVITAQTYLFLKKGKRHVPPIVRAILGIIFIALGLVGFLPIIGFWMIPLGLALLATDFPPLGRWLNRRLRQARKKYR